MTEKQPTSAPRQKPNKTAALSAKPRAIRTLRRRRKSAQSDAVLNGPEPAEPINITMAG